MEDKAARIRTGTVTPIPPPGRADPRISVDLSHLRRLEAQAKRISFMPRQPSGSVLNGRHASRLRGRGLNFEELRDYLPSDDIRSIDWKVTARTGTPHVRVYTEERDRPTLIVVDQRMSMFFGSVLNMKSVTAAECAALAAFRIFDQGDRVGGIVFGDEMLAEIRPARSRHALTAFLTALADANGLLHADAPSVEPIAMNRVLESVARLAPRNHLVLIFSDFDIVDETTERLIAGLSRRNDLVLGLVSDPYSDDMPREQRIVVSDGTLQAEINTGDQQTHRSLREFAKGRLASILDWQRRFGIPVLPLSAAEDSVAQMRHLMGIAGARR
ncbi:DUF58 domain-containing protein [Paracoccus aestuariivivens]|uniref:DUF58 domain-containing protein n=1 Tax=Paracoccus aestuariivivens TaxID=1820333 RepID=A0A6L6J8I9_9RHOB|nr:DUF58 domain-containing protein [Paracoccus aestuariivivens]MTH77059.1 DUF58 domain-containing protein [Paracoccus aestuariivivens]